MDSVRDIIRDLRETLECEILAGRRKVSFDDSSAAEFAGLPGDRRTSVAAPDAVHSGDANYGKPKPKPPVVAAPVAAAAAPAAAAPAATAPAPPAAAPASGTLDSIASAVMACRGCALAATRTRPVPGEGNGSAPEIMFVGEAPGHDEDIAGRPFVGRAGQLLDKMIAAMGFRREEVFIANILKCRPPNNRTPTVQEMSVCMPFLKAQIAAVRPRTLVALGATAYRGLKNDEKVSISRARGIWDEFDGIPLMPTFHPAYLLRTPGAKRIVWDDLKLVLARLGRSPAKR